MNIKSVMVRSTHDPLQRGRRMVNVSGRCRSSAYRQAPGDLVVAATAMLPAGSDWSLAYSSVRPAVEGWHDWVVTFFEPHEAAFARLVEQRGAAFDAHGPTAKALAQGPRPTSKQLVNWVLSGEVAPPKAPPDQPHEQVVTFSASSHYATHECKTLAWLVSRFVNWLGRINARLRPYALGRLSRLRVARWWPLSLETR